MTTTFGRTTYMDTARTSDSSESVHKWVRIVFMEGDEADHVLAMIDAGETASAVDYLRQWDYGDSDDITYAEPWGRYDRTTDHEGYTLAWNTALGYVSLQRRTDEAS